MIEKLHFITQGEHPGAHLDYILEACKAGVKWIQLRMKDEPINIISKTALEAKKMCDDHGVKLIINDYPTVAIITKADGVHLGLNDMPVNTVKEISGDKIIIGATANTLEDIIKHENEKADYVGLGPYRFTRTKKNLSPILGIAGYEKIMGQCNTRKLLLPVIAIGGIELADIPFILNTGVHGIAISSLFCQAKDKKGLVQKIFQFIKNVK